MRDFDDAMTAAINADPFTLAGAAAIWHGEAVRWRRGNSGALDMDGIAQATAQRLRTAQDQQLTFG
jgi:hypothetical protein